MEMLIGMVIGGVGFVIFLYLVVPWIFYFSGRLSKKLHYWDWCQKKQDEMDRRP